MLRAVLLKPPSPPIDLLLDLLLLLLDQTGVSQLGDAIRAHRAPVGVPEDRPVRLGLFAGGMLPALIVPPSVEGGATLGLDTQILEREKKIINNLIFQKFYRLSPTQRVGKML